jgi:hypothetical protein
MSYWDSTYTSLGDRYWHQEANTLGTMCYIEELYHDKANAVTAAMRVGVASESHGYELHLVRWDRDDGSMVSWTSTNWGASSTSTLQV